MICIVVGIVLFTSSQLLFADSRTFDLKAIASGVSRVEYRIGEEMWHDVDMQSPQIQLPRSGGTTLQLNLYGKNKKKPTVTYTYRFDERAGTWVHEEPAEQAAVVDVPVKTAAPSPVAAQESAPALQIFDLKAIASGVSRIEYRLGDEEWHDVDLESPQIELPPSDSATLQLNLYGKNKKKPTVTYAYRFDERAGTWIHGDQGTKTVAATSAVAESAVAVLVTEVAVIEPVTEVAVVEPVTEVAVVEPVTEVAVVEPVTEVAVVEPITEVAVVEPVTEVAVVEPVTEVAVVEPIIKSTRFDLKAIASGVSRIEYRLGDEGWHNVDLESPQIQLPCSGGTTLQLNLYGKNKKKPTVTYTYRFDERAGTWVCDEPAAETAVPPASAIAAAPASAEEIVRPDEPLARAESWTFDLNAFESEVTRIEYHYGDGLWRDADMESLRIPLPDSDAATNLMLRLHVKSKKLLVLSP